MEFFRDAYSVRLLGHTDKYLCASDDQKSVSQKKGKDSYGVIWRVELIPGRNTIRLKGVYDLYLKASDMAFLLGATGKKVMQSHATKADSGLEWEPVSAGTFVKLRTNGDKFLRANGGMPPYRNSITHDVPVLASNQHVVLWDVEVVRKREAASLPPSRLISPRVSNASPPPPEPRPRPQPQAESSDDDDDIPVPANIPKPHPRTNSAPAKIEIPPTPEDSSSPSEPASPIASPPPRRRAALTEENLPPRRRGSPLSEPVRNVPQRRRASPPREARQDESPPPRRRAVDADYDASPPPRRRASPSRDSRDSRDSTYDQSPPPRRRASPSRDSRHSTYDQSPPPRRRASPSRDSIYDQSPPPRRRASPTRDSTYDQSPPPRRRAALVDETPAPRTRAPLQDYDSAASERRGRQSQDLDSSPEPSTAPARRSARPVDYEDSENPARPRSQKVKSPDVRRIFYSVAEDDGEVLASDDDTFGNFMFKGHGLEDLTEDVQLVTGLKEDIILCMRNPMSGKLYKMRLALPPNKAPLNIVVVRSNSQFGRTLLTQAPR